MATTPVLNTPNQRTFVSLTISTAADGLSTVLDCGGMVVASIQMSTAWTTADLTFLGSPVSSATLQDLYTSTGGALTFVTTALHNVTCDPFPFSAMRFIQLRSGTTATAVAQAAARTIGISLIPYGPIK